MENPIYAPCSVIWQDILRMKPSDIFVDSPHAQQDRHTFDGLAQPGFVGCGYRSGGMLLIGQNPGNDAIGKGLSEADKSQYVRLEQVRDANVPAGRIKSFRDLMQELNDRVMPTWPIVQNVVNRLLAETGVSLSQISYLNLIKFRSTNSSIPAAVYQRSWPKTERQITCLKPGLIVCLGKSTYSNFNKHYRGNVKPFSVQRAIGDTRLPQEGIEDINAIVRWLNGQPELRSAIQGAPC
jgi:hypothetical protein